MTYFLFCIKIKSQPKPSSGYYILKLTTKYFQKGGLFQKIYMHFDFFKGEQAFYITGWLNMEKMLQWYEISEDHWSEIGCNYPFKGRTPVLLREHTYAVHFLTIITRTNDAPQFLIFHLFSLTFSSAGGQWDSPCGPQAMPPPPELSTSLHSLPKYVKSIQGEPKENIK